MQYKIKHEIPGRIRFDLLGKIPERQSIALEEIFIELPYVTKCTAYPKAGSLAIFYEAQASSTLEQTRELLLARLT